VSQKNIPNIFDWLLENQLPDFDNFWSKYSRPNLPSNDHSVSHLTQRLYLHYLEKTQPAKYHFFYPMRYNCLINITHKNTFCSHFWLFGWQFIQLSIIQNIIDTAVNEWRKRLLACVRIVGQHFQQFYCRQLKNGQLDEMSAKVSGM